jgi:hypothetical protein
MLYEKKYTICRTSKTEEIQTSSIDCGSMCHRNAEIVEDAYVVGR